MKKKFHLPLNLQLFADDVPDPGVESAPAAGEQPTDAPDVAADGDDKQNNFEKAFAKRLQAERSKWETEQAEARKQWESEQSEKYKDFDTYKKATEYLQKSSGISDVMTLKEQLELQELQERADQQQVPPEVLKRIDELEAKAAKADEIEAASKQQQEWQTFETSLKDFVKDKTLDDKPLDHMTLWQYMHENGVSKPEVAFKAMKADILEPKLASAKTDAVNEYLKTKQAPKTEGSPGAAAQTSAPPPKGWKGVEQRAAERLRASREAQ